ncbi:hypothetical protein PUR34_41470 [Streptomyces sp. JV185]|uniref:hypothetical protein n=1 Tax=Streptomyces sp. JV185 TaxID=858638 RepID=UPI002E786828|nr:hypothetical protein [Streptomyces sp. JV185]MEE1774475.1 hypothetical protein [Streptomyces sp. JV185]
MTTTTAICAEYSTHTTEQQPVGPCVLRPGHRGHIHQDMRGMQWATRPGSNECAVCGGGVAYLNYRGQPFCGPCANGEAPSVDPADELRARLTAALRAIGRGEQEIVELRRRLAETEQDRDTAQEGRRLYAAACAEAMRSRLSAEGAIARVRALAERWQAGVRPGESHPGAAAIRAALDNAA